MNHIWIVYDFNNMWSLIEYILSRTRICIPTRTNPYVWFLIKYQITYIPKSDCTVNIHFRVQTVYKLYIYNANSCSLYFIIPKGSNPLAKNNTLVTINVAKDRHSLPKTSSDPNDKAWKAYISSSSHSADSTLQICVESSPNAIVSVYKLTTRLYTKDADLKDQIVTVKEKEEIFVIFNPWCKGIWISIKLFL